MASDVQQKVAKMEEKVEKKVSKTAHDYKGFVAGVFSGVTKLTGMSRLMKPSCISTVTHSNCQSVIRSTLSKSVSKPQTHHGSVVPSSVSSRPCAMRA